MYQVMNDKVLQQQLFWKACFVYMPRFRMNRNCFTEYCQNRNQIQMYLCETWACIFRCTHPHTCSLNSSFPSSDIIRDAFKRKMSPGMLLTQSACATPILTTYCIVQWLEKLFIPVTLSFFYIFTMLLSFF